MKIVKKDAVEVLKALKRHKSSLNSLEKQVLEIYQRAGALLAHTREAIKEINKTTN